MFSGNNPIAIKEMQAKIKINRLIRLNFVLSLKANNPLAKTRLIKPLPINP